MKKYILTFLVLISNFTFSQKKIENYPYYYNILYNFNVIANNPNKIFEGLKKIEKIKSITTFTQLYYDNKYNNENSLVKYFFNDGLVNEKINSKREQDILLSKVIYDKNRIEKIITFVENKDVGYGYDYLYEKDKLVKIISKDYNYEKNKPYSPYTINCIFNKDTLIKIENYAIEPWYKKLDVEYLTKNKNTLEVSYEIINNEFKINSITKITDLGANKYLFKRYEIDKISDKIISEINYDILIGLIAKTDCETIFKQYDVKGYLIKEIREPYHGTKKVTIEYLYDDKYNNIILKTIYEDKSKGIGYEKSTFNVEGKITQFDTIEEIVGIKKYTSSRKRYFYNEYGDVIKTTLEEDANNQLKLKHTNNFVYKYDTSNNWIEKEVIEDGKSFYKDFRTIEYLK